MRLGTICSLVVSLLLCTAHHSLAAEPGPTSAATDDVTSGREVFRICQACHSLDPGRNLIGPSLAGLIGRKAGTEPGFDYSQAMKQASITWDTKSLNAYLADPQKVVPGNRMPFGGLKSDLDRQELVAFLAVAKPGASAAHAPAAISSSAKPAHNESTQGPHLGAMQTSHPCRTCPM